MADTIEWLETIGKNANLRRASTDELTIILEQAEASEALKAAVKMGDGSLLSAEFGHKEMADENEIHTPAREEDPEEDEGASMHGKPLTY
jgi:enoyl-CoA hydratase/carnithine racemase